MVAPVDYLLAGLDLATPSLLPVVALVIHLRIPATAFRNAFVGPLLCHLMENRMWAATRLSI